MIRYRWNGGKGDRRCARTDCHPTTPTPENSVRTLSRYDQESIFVYLLKELIRLNGGEGLTPVSHDQLGYFEPRKAADFLFVKYGPKLTPEREAEIAERIARNAEGIPVEQMLVDLRLE